MCSEEENILLVVKKNQLFFQAVKHECDELLIISEKYYSHYNDLTVTC